MEVMNKKTQEHFAGQASKQSEAIFKLFAKRGVVGDNQIDDERIRAAQQKKRKNAYHNTELLLRQYRNLAWMMECFPDTVAEELEQSFENIDEMIDRLDMEMTMGNRKIENRMENVRKTRLVIDRINEALSVLKKKPEDGERLYELIYLTYIAPETLNHNDLLYRLNFSSRHYYRLREQAISVLSIRLWSAPGKDVDFWLELLSALEQ
jgi:hypothetical protein